MGYKRTGDNTEQHGEHRDHEPSEHWTAGSRGGGGGGEGDQSRGFRERSGGGGKVNPLTRGGGLGGAVMG